MYTSVALIALAGFFTGPAAPSEPVWRNDYFEAQRIGKKDHKPLAVFVGSGSAGYENIPKEGKMNAETRKVLQENFVCVYLDTAHQESTDLVSAFSITKGQGLVISNRAGDYQVFHCDGTLPESELLRQLNQVGQLEEAIPATHSYYAPQTRTSYYPPANVSVRPAANC
jgi:hypothetical protein